MKSNEPRALILGLLNDLEALPHRDTMALDRFKRRGVMILGNIFGEDHRYVGQFRAIPFRYSYIVWKQGAADRKWLEGVETTHNLLETIIEEADTFGQEATVRPQSEQSGTGTPAGIFVAHGHNQEMLDEVEGFLLRLGLSPVVLEDRPNLGQTVIEKVEANSEIAAAIVLFSPDDIGYSMTDGPNQARPRARQNVIFELGYFTGALRRGRTILVYKAADEFDIPSDLAGVVYIPYDPDDRWKGMLVTELDGMGLDLDTGKVARALPK